MLRRSVAGVAGVVGYLVAFPPNTSYTYGEEPELVRCERRCDTNAIRETIARVYALQGTNEDYANLYRDDSRCETSFVASVGREEIKRGWEFSKAVFGEGQVHAVVEQPDKSQLHAHETVFWVHATWGWFSFWTGVRVVLDEECKIALQEDCSHGKELVTPESAGVVVGTVARGMRRANSRVINAMMKLEDAMSRWRDAYHKKAPPEASQQSTVSFKLDVESEGAKMARELQEAEEESERRRR